MFIIYLRHAQDERGELYHDLTEDEAREIYNDYADDPGYDEVIVIDGDVIAASSNPKIQQATGF
jgi:hypothetical protein